MKKTNLFKCLVAMVVLLGTTAAANAQTVATGTIGACTWELTGSSPNYTLTITADGYSAMGPIANPSWDTYRTQIASVIIGPNVLTIGMGAFQSHTRITSIVIPDDVETIDLMAFYNCRGLTSVSFGYHLTTIRAAAFQNCGLTGTLSIPDNVTSIGDGAFSGCSGITEINIGNNLTNIAALPISNGGLTAINAGWTNTAYSSEDGVLFNKNKTTLVRYPAGKSGAAYTIPNSVTTIDNSAFFGCSGLTSVSIPNSVTSIGNNAFQDCNNLNTVKVSWTNPSSVTLGTDLFGSAPSPALNTRTLIIPAGTASLYEDVAPWSSFQQPFDEYYDIADVTISIIGDITYTSNALSPAIEVRCGAKLLIEGADYTVGYSTETQIGDVVTITLTGIGDFSGGTKSKTFIIAKAIGTASVTLSGWTYGTAANSPVPVSATNGVDNVTYQYDSIGGSYNSPTQPVNAGTYRLVATFAATAIHDVVNDTTTFTIAKAAGIFGTPAAVSTTYTPTLTLGSLSLPAGYAFVDGATSLSVADSGSSFAATYIYPDGNYIASGTIKVNIAKAAGTASVTLSDWTYSTAANSPVPVSATNGIGSVTYQYDSISGSYNSPVHPVNAGTYRLIASFAATANYEAVNATTTFTIAKATGIFVPLAAISVIHAEGLTLDDIELPTNYAWSSHWQNTNSALVVGANQYFIAIYTEPSGNYEPANGHITVNVILVNAATPSITAQPQSSTVDVGGSAPLSVTAVITDGGTLSYQWYENTTNSNTGGTAVGTNSNSYSAPTTTVGTFYYYVVVTNTNNSVSGTTTATATSNVAVVTVNNLVDAAIPIITAQPQSSTVSIGSSAPLSVTAVIIDGGTLSYQWYENTTNSNTGGTAVGTNSNSYSAPTTTAGTFYYYVVVTNTNNSVSGTTTATATSNVAVVTCQEEAGALSNNANLGSLSVTGYSISPAFDGNTTSYTLTVPNNVSTITISAAAADSKAQGVIGAGVKPIDVGSNEFAIVVTAEDGTQKVYTITITRSSANNNGGNDGNDGNPDNPATAVETQDVAALQIYPNPVFDGQLTIDNEQLNAGDKVEIYNVNGALVLSVPSTGSGTGGNITINIGHLPAGIYIVRVGNKAAKVVKQ